MRGDDAAHRFLARHYFMQCSKYELSAHAFVCASGDYYVILDAKHDRYLCLRRQEFQQLRPLMQIDGESLGSAADVLGDPTAAARLLAAQLLSLGILNEGAGACIDAQIRPPLIVPDESLLTTVQPPPVLSSLAYFPIFVVACWRTARRLRNCPLYGIFEIHRSRVRDRQRQSDMKEARV